MNSVLQTVGSAVKTLDLKKPPSPAEADRHARNRILANLRTQTIARRRTYLDTTGTANPASDTISIHPLVHEILRSVRHCYPHRPTGSNCAIQPLLGRSRGTLRLAY